MHLTGMFHRAYTDSYYIITNLIYQGRTLCIHIDTFPFDENNKYNDMHQLYFLYVL